MHEIEWEGVVTRGHRVASGAGGDARFPLGTIRPQLPFFRRAIANFDAYLGGPPFPGTINVALAEEMAIVPPDHRIAAVRWTDQFPPENFLLSRCALIHDGIRHPAFLYMPDPATKPDHFQPADMVEILASFVPGIGYGDRVTIVRSVRDA